MSSAQPARPVDGGLTFEGQRRARATAFARHFGAELDEAAASRWFAEYFEHYRESWALHDDVAPALDALAARLPGVRFGIITTASSSTSRRSSPGSRSTVASTSGPARRALVLNPTHPRRARTGPVRTTMHLGPSSHRTCYAARRRPRRPGRGSS